MAVKNSSLNTARQTSSDCYTSTVVMLLFWQNEAVGKADYFLYLSAGQLSVKIDTESQRPLNHLARPTHSSPLHHNTRTPKNSHRKETQRQNHSDTDDSDGQIKYSKQIILLSNVQPDLTRYPIYLKPCLLIHI